MDFLEKSKDEIIENIEKYNETLKKRKIRNSICMCLLATGVVLLYVYLRFFNSVFVEDKYGNLVLQYSTAWVVNCPGDHACFDGEEKDKVEVDFGKCPNVKRLNVEEGITYITCRSSSDSLEVVSLPSTLLEVWGFGGCSNLENVIWEKAPAGAMIGSHAFAGTSIKEIVVPEGVACIGNEAFARNEKLTKVTLPNTVKEMYGEVFENCTNLQEITWSDALYFMPHGTFVNCEKLAVLNNTDNLRSITYSALTGTQITADKLPDNVHCFGGDEYTFSDYEANKWLVNYSHTYDPDEEIAFLAAYHDLPLELFQMKAEEGTFWLDGKYYTLDMGLEEFMANGNWKIADEDVDDDNNRIIYYDLTNFESGNGISLTVCEDEILRYRFYVLDDCHVMLPDGVNNFGMCSERVPYLYGADEYVWEYKTGNGSKSVKVSQSWNYSDREDATSIYIDKEI